MAQRMQPNPSERVPPHNAPHEFIESDTEDAYNFGSCLVSPACQPEAVPTKETEHER